MSVATRYSPFLVVLHWTVALLVITNLILGGQIADHIADTDPHKLSYLKIHMIIGGTVLVLMVIRLFVRISTPKPPPVVTKHPFLDKLAKFVQYGMYVLVIVGAASGIVLSMEANLPAIVFQHNGQPLPTDWFVYPARIVHGVLMGLLGLFVLLHVSGAIYHQFILKDHLLRRMSFGKKEDKANKNT